MVDIDQQVSEAEDFQEEDESCSEVIDNQDYQQSIEEAIEVRPRLHSFEKAVQKDSINQIQEYITRQVEQLLEQCASEPK